MVLDGDIGAVLEDVEHHKRSVRYFAIVDVIGRDPPNPSICMTSGDPINRLAVLVLGMENTEESLRRVARVGEAGPLFRGASGLAILAALSAEDVAGVVTRAAAEPDRNVVLAQVARVRELGCAISHGANHPGVNGIAAAVGSTSATAHTTSIAVSGPASRWDDSRMLANARTDLLVTTSNRKESHDKQP
ncbi:IclR family transcriptional regulator C-terminal domain-containing protein [Cryobacterium sp. PH31-O1]|uniref:IclR family transcriptional regulator domain-containing protein n=1 Tax=Cryobacterium sp. PH31-O1 TaxID=3046306 RepID=UPI0024B9A812|nr:IclR family transcriptional regulator C-terminal domain-containing protein [Cryobacterium sp. PH31-O1]MDJ0337312.1 IclR family transcriptional regulator C-terminal domain-containing protein [Cryobacterium sp. PH31-O1]